MSKEAELTPPQAVGLAGPQASVSPAHCVPSSLCPQFCAGAGGTGSLAEGMEAVWDLMAGGEGAFHQV